ncbi:TPA: hypothetical protein OS528_005248 [Klebsiella pneumoniae]|uniref:hypothetical protein n=1 Tax=Klebsiella pneumoniae TaxID=573 RepID=UPI003981BE6C|nr:hypothetical protein [Klebsiella pneumoniae]
MTITLQAVNELIASLESAGELSIKETKVMALAKAYQQLAAENVALKRVPETDSVAMLLALDSFRSESLPDVGLQKAFESLMYHRKTPTTDAYLAGIKADGASEFISRLQQCVDEGDFVGDEVAVIVGAIDCGKEFCEQLREGAK